MVGTLQALTDESKAITVHDITENCVELTDRQKEFIFNYMKEGDIPDHLRLDGSSKKNSSLRIYEPIEDYKMNVIVLLELIFNYQFKPFVDNHTR